MQQVYAGAERSSTSPNPGSLGELPSPKDFPHWVLREPGTKLPLDARTGFHARSNDPRTMVGYDHARDQGRASGLRAMFVITRDDPFFVADLDGCVNPATGEIAPWALNIMERLQTRTTYSISGTGIHVFGIGKKPGTKSQHSGGRGPNGFTGGVYDHSRPIALTDEWVAGFPRDVRDCQAALDALYPELFPEPQRRSNGQIDPADDAAGVCDYGKPLSPRMTDRTILNKLLTDGGAAKFQALWSGDDSYHNGDTSDADAAFFARICFYTQRRAQIIRIARQSERDRDKWLRPDYLTRTLDFVLSVQTERFRADDDPLTQWVLHPDGTLERVAANGGAAWA